MSQLLLFPMEFSKRLANLRKARGLTQKGLAELVGLQMLQIYRYEAGTSQPTLDALRKLALALGITADELIFDPDERKPDESLLLQFESVQRLDPEEKHLVKELIEGILIKHDAKRWFQSPAAELIEPSQQPVSATPPARAKRPRAQVATVKKPASKKATKK